MSATAARSPRGRVSTVSRSLWRLRLARECSRWLIQALALAGLLASARFAIAPPRPVVSRAALRGPVQTDLAAMGFASLFARRYLSWNANDPEAHRLALAGFVGSGMDPDAGLQLPAGGEQQVQWTEVVQARERRPGEHMYTVAAQTDGAGLLYLTVDVARRADGTLVLGGYPAFVGAPASALARGAPDAGLREVEDPALATVAERALRNYLAGSASELAADLMSGARISLPALTLSLQSLAQLRWAPGGGAVIALAQAQDARGAQYTLAYELDVTRAQGRWEVSAIQMNPDT